MFRMNPIALVLGAFGAFGMQAKIRQAQVANWLNARFTPDIPGYIPSPRRTNVATMKREAKKRRNIRAKSSKRKVRRG